MLRFAKRIVGYARAMGIALSALRKFALSALRLDKRHPERRLRRRRKLAARPPDYRAELLGLRKIPASNLAIWYVCKGLPCLLDRVVKN